MTFLAGKVQRGSSIDVLWIHISCFFMSIYVCFQKTTLCYYMQWSPLAMISRGSSNKKLLNSICKLPNDVHWSFFQNFFPQYLMFQEVFVKYFYDSQPIESFVAHKLGNFSACFFAFDQTLIIQFSKDYNSHNRNSLAQVFHA